MFRTTHQGLAFAGVLIAGSIAAAQDVPNGFQNSSAQSNAEIFVYTTNNLAVSMRPVASHICFLTMVTGNLNETSALSVNRSTADQQELFQEVKNTYLSTILDENSDTWKLSGWTYGDPASGNSPAAEAVCVPLSDFIMDDYGATTVGGMFCAHSIANLQGSCEEQTMTVADAWGAYATTFLSGIRGNFKGRAQLARIVEGSQGQPTTVHADNTNCTPTYTEGCAYSFIAASLVEDTYPNYSLVHFAVNSDWGGSPQLLARTKDAVCYFSAIGGDFRSRDERVQISLQWQGDEEWWAVDFPAGAGAVNAAVSCLNYDQRHPAPVAPD